MLSKMAYLAEMPTAGLLSDISESDPPFACRLPFSSAFFWLVRFGDVHLSFGANAWDSGALGRYTLAPRAPRIAALLSAIPVCCCRHCYTVTCVSV